MSSPRKSTKSLTLFELLVPLVFASAVHAEASATGHPGGQSLYEQLCASCHGKQGRGDGAVSDDVLLRPRDFALNAFKFDTDADWQRGTDLDLANVIRYGPAAYGGSVLMPSWNSLSDDDVAALVAYIRHLQHNGGG